MAVTIEQLSIDARDPFTLAGWWAQALGWTRDPAEEPESDEQEIWIHKPDDETDGILFVEVSDPKVGKNRLHLDLRPDDQAAEVTRFTELGATRIDIGQGDVSWVVLADPEGNEFCILSSRR